VEVKFCTFEALTLLAAEKSAIISDRMTPPEVSSYSGQHIVGPVAALNAELVTERRIFWKSQPSLPSLTLLQLHSYHSENNIGK